MICDYGCEQEAKYQFKNGKRCCSDNIAKCPNMRKRVSESSKGKIISEKQKEKIRKIQKERMKNLNVRKEHSIKMKELWSSKEYRDKVIKAQKDGWTEDAKKKQKEIIKETWKNEDLIKKHKRSQKLAWENQKSKLNDKEYKKKISDKTKLLWEDENFRYNRQVNIEKLKNEHKLFCKEEEIRECTQTKRLQVRCKLNSCRKWFTPTYNQLYYRIFSLEHPSGTDGGYLYCSDECKQICSLYNLRSDPFKDLSKAYTNEEYQTFRKFVLERDNNKCQFCGERATDVHHERPQKLEPFFSLDPDYAWACCEKCHYKYGHKDECSTGKLANTICI